MDRWIDFERCPAWRGGWWRRGGKGRTAIVAAATVALAALAVARVAPVLADAAAEAGLPYARPGPPRVAPPRAGTCHSHTVVPATWRDEPVDIVVREATTTFDIEPARFAAARRDIVTDDAWTSVVAVPARRRTEVRELEQEAARARWFRGGDLARPASAEDLAAATASGIDLDVATGTCIDEHYRADTFVDGQRRVLVREAGETLAVIGPRWREESLAVTLKPGHDRIVEIPPLWKEVEERVPVESAVSAREPAMAYATLKRELIETPAMITRVAEPPSIEPVEVRRLMRDSIETRRPLPAEFATLRVPEPVRAGGYRWVPRGTAPIESAYARTGRSLCRLQRPAVTLEYEVEVEVDPGRFERDEVPAIRETVDTVELVADAVGTARPVAEVVASLTRSVRLSEPRVERRRVLCDAEVTRDLVRRLQRALEREGHSPDGIDGGLGPDTLAALRAYQRRVGLVSGGLTVETLDRLGIER